MTIHIQPITVRRAEGYLLQDKDQSKDVLLLSLQEGILVCEGGLKEESPSFWSFLRKEDIENPIFLQIDDSHMNPELAKLIESARSEKQIVHDWIEKNYNYAEKERLRKEAERLEVCSDCGGKGGLDLYGVCSSCLGTGEVPTQTAD